jgi:hypothetical protein
MSLAKMPFISAVQLVRVDDSTVIPTVLYYKDKRPLSGREANNNCPSPDLLVEDFKLELGKTDPDATPRRSSLTENTPRKTAVGLLKDFFDETLKKIEKSLAIQGLGLPNRILIAEPLSLGGGNQPDETWLSYYRKAVRKTLQGRFEEIDFMPEPFAVFQYYRYGLRHPLVSEQRKHIALVLDFGGGTFDVSVVETTKAGEISGGGTNSRPLGARSVQVGGFYINRLLAETLLFSVTEVEKQKIRKSLSFFYENRNAGDEFIQKLSESEKVFFYNMKILLHSVERAKLNICNSIANWNLNANLSGVAPYQISIPTNPFTLSGNRASVKLDANQIQKIYVDQVWSAKLRDTIINTIERAKNDLGGQEISVVLLSGGSSNIRWLRPLIERDLRKYLDQAQILELNENFQEIVAKGLATECARRYYTKGQGDFRAVTYNRLCLLLRSDDGDVETKQFRPVTDQLSHGAKDIDHNVLLPAASSLRGLTGQKLQWKVKLAKLPKHVLHYYFMRSSYDPEDIQARHNVVETKVITPAGTQFQQNIVVELVVREDGTAEPRFLYGNNNLRDGTVAEGTPFYIDMTFAAEEATGETYLGFDLGTSTSACSYVSSTDITWIEQRAKSADWLELAELVSSLPYPAAAALAKYMSEMEPRQRLERGREAIEALLTIAAYFTLAELSAYPKPSTSLFKGMMHRSAGPLWGLLKQCLPLVRPDQASFLCLSPLVRGNAAQIDQWVNEIASSKHARMSTVDYVTFLAMLGNHVAKIFSTWTFGVFEGVVAKRFSAGRFRGLFRSLTGSSQTFIHVIEYEGQFSFSGEDVYVINKDEGKAMILSPFYMWGLGSSPVETDLYEYDNEKKGEFFFRSIQEGSTCVINAAGDLRETWEFLVKMREREQPRPLFEKLSFASPKV